MISRGNTKNSEETGSTAALYTRNRTCHPGLNAGLRAELSKTESYVDGTFVAGVI
jgi:hypothetical protein